MFIINIPSGFSRKECCHYHAVIKSVSLSKLGILMSISKI